MSEYETNKKEMKEFIELLLQYAQDERLIDINRCLLAQDLNFDACSLYNYILFNYSEKNNANKNVITFTTLKKFIQINLGIKISDYILSKFFDFYSPKNDYDDNERFLEYIQFVDIFYPRYNFQLRRFLQQRNGLNNNLKSLDNVTKVLLQKLFIKEFNMVKTIFYTLNNYLHFITKNNSDIFKIISNNKNIINKQDLINFFNLYHKDIYYTEEDINSIIISLSLNKSYNDKKDNPIEGISYETFSNVFNINKNLLSSLPSYQNNSIFNKPIDKISLFTSIITKTIQLEKKVEESKISIVTRNDFNINLIISFFIQNKNEDKIDFNNFFNKLNISLNDLEKELLIRRIDLTKKGFMNKSDLFDFFVPFNKIYREKIEKSIINNDDNINDNISDLKFSNGTMIYINNLFNVMIKGEKEINMKKIELNNIDKRFVENTFDEIVNINISDENNSQNLEEKEYKYINYFNNQQLYKYLSDKLKIKMTDNGFNLFFIRLDKLRRGKIQILEFSDEMKHIL